jgi:hypothetical protein
LRKSLKGFNIYYVSEENLELWDRRIVIIISSINRLVED